jgi:polysaccharide biosynthesis/export protein
VPGGGTHYAPALHRVNQRSGDAGRGAENNGVMDLRRKETRIRNGEFLCQMEAATPPAQPGRAGASRRGAVAPGRRRRDKRGRTTPMPASTRDTSAAARRTFLAALLPAASMVAVAACTPGGGLPRLPEETASAYRLGPQDQVRVTVFNDPRLTGEFRVSDSGEIALPLVGAVQASGRTTTEVEREIERTMRQKGLFRDPSVAVEVLQYRPIFVLGMVERGGQFPYQPGMTALTAVAVAGGFNYRAVRDYVSITRIGSDGRPVEYRAAREAIVLPGDTVTVFERRF